MPPYTGFPYGFAPSYCFPLTEWSVAGLFIICLFHSFKKGTGYTAYLIGGLIFGLLLEYIDVKFLRGYDYGKFMMMLGSPPLDIPLWIGMGWGVIIYSSRLFTDRLGLGLAAAAALDALIAINIDLTMDVVAYRLHMWDWGWSGMHMDPLNSDWFGIPYGNFFGWLIVVFTYSYFSRLFERSLSRSRLKPIALKIVIPLGAIVISEIILFSFFKYINNFLKEQFGVTPLQRLLALLLFLVLILFVGWRRRKQVELTKLPFAGWVIPAWFHLYFFLWFFIAGFNFENKWMTIFAFVNLFAGILIHLPGILPFSSRTKNNTTMNDPVTSHKSLK